MDLVLLAAATAAGLSPLRLGLIGMTLFFPWGLGVVVVALVWRGKRQEGGMAVRFLEGVVAEMRSGASLRHSLAASMAATGDHGLADECLVLPWDELGGRIGEALPGTGPELAIALAGAARSGAPPADLFDEMASLALAHDEIRREIRVAAAPGRVAAGVFVGAPVAYLGWRWASGDLPSLFATGNQRGIAFVGSALFLCGIAGALLILWRAR